MIQKREFVMLLLFSCLTCGIYMLYWLYKTTEDINTMAGNDGKEVSPTTVILLSIVTCGIYNIYWYYQQGNRIQAVSLVNNIPCADSGNTYLMWYLVGMLVCGIGSWIGIYMFVKNLNILVDCYNANTQNP